MPTRRNNNISWKESILDDNKYKICQECGCKLRINRYRKHMALQHDIQVSDPPMQDTELVKCPTCSAMVKKENLQKHIQRVHKPSKSTSVNKKNNKGIRLISKRGMKLPGRHSCTNCSKIVNNPTRYAKSNKGPVILCAPCKSEIRRRSFPLKKRDALDFAVSGGRFEGNRRRH